MKRRDFLSLAILGGFTSSLPVIIAAFFPSTIKLATAEDKNKWYKVGKVADLDATGQLLVNNPQVGPVLIIGTSKQPNGLTAVNPTCTHKGCTVNWEGQEFICPCHQAVFNSHGQVLHGPARSSLKVFSAKIQHRAVWVKSV
jgi:cytochrome b6-f complex iron-sulfur subunit